MGVLQVRAQITRQEGARALAVAESLAATDEAEAAELVAEAARIVSEDAAADWLFVLPNIIVADKGITGLPKNAISESFDVTGLSGS